MGSERCVSQRCGVVSDICSGAMRVVMRCWSDVCRVCVCERLCQLVNACVCLWVYVLAGCVF